MSTINKQPLKGGAFVISQTNPESVFIPEEWNEEQIMIADSVKEFCMQEIHGLGPIKAAELSAEKDLPFIVELVEKAGEMGFCGVGIEEQYGGMDLDFNTGILFVEALALGFSFATTLGAQTSIGSLPIVYYGTPEQKEKYLPGIATGELKASYCLTEPSAGSDANSGKSKVKLSPDGSHYLLNGQKMWITNGGFADIFIVFAKIDDDENLSAFIVEKGFGGIEIGKEEKKMGIKASSTTQVFFTDCPVPLDNLLGERGGGFKMALNILNTGRIKLCAGAVGGCKFGLTNAVKYTNERKQFNKPIAEFGAMQHKLGQMAMLTFATESALYRTGRNIDEKEAEFVAGGMPKRDAKIKATREFAVECALLKVFGSEAADYVIDEVIQIYGGMGYAVETGAEMGYRDARIMRIYEGTNEINRMLSLAELTKRAIKTKEVDLMGAGKKLPAYVLGQFMPFKSSSGLDEETRLIENLKRIFLLISGTAGKKLGKKMVDEQEIVMNLADIMAQIYMAESTLLRIQKLKLKKEEVKLHAAKESMLKLFVYEAQNTVRRVGTDAIMSFASGMEQKTLLYILRKLTPRYDVNPKELRRQVAKYLIEKNEYCF